jgi:hypothetical protein
MMRDTTNTRAQASHQRAKCNFTTRPCRPSLMLCHSGTPTMITATITPQNAGSSILPLISHKVFFLSTYSLALQQQQRQPYSKYMPTLLLRSVTPVLCCIRDPPPSLSFCNRSSSSKGLLLLLLLFFFLTPSSALLLHISKT